MTNIENIKAITFRIKFGIHSNAANGADTKIIKSEIFKRE